MNITPLPGSPRHTLERITAPWVTSGSSPASLRTAAVAWPWPEVASTSPKLGRARQKGASAAQLLTKYEIDPLMGGTSLHSNFVALVKEA